MTSREAAMTPLADWLTYTHLTETVPGTKEIRSYLQAQGCIYLIDGRLAWLPRAGPAGVNRRRTF